MGGCGEPTGCRVGDTGRVTEELWPDPVPGAPYTARSLALLVLGDAARRTSDFARSMVPTGPSRSSLDGMLLSDALQLRTLVEQLTTAAVVAEREDGTDWAEIADTLGVTQAVAEEMWNPVVESWLDDVEVAAGHEHHHDLPDALAQPPDSMAHQLDEWVVRHREPLEPIDGEHPVTDMLQVMHPMLELLHLQGRQRRLRNQYGDDPPPALLLPILDRAADVHSALASGSPGADSEHTEEAERARIKAAYLRSRIAQESSPDTD